MRCKACDAEMVLMSVIPDNRGVRRFEHHGFKCIECNEIEQHRLFMKYGRECNPEPMPAIQQLHDCRVDATQGFLKRLIAKMRAYFTEGGAPTEQPNHFLIREGR
jgi:hypothetical protein